MPFSVTITGPRLPVPATHTISQESAFVVGRGRKNDFVANHPLVSRYHARFDTTPSGIQVVDLNSAAGTVVNGEAIPAEHAVPLNPGDVVDIGPYRFVLTLIADGQPANHSVTAGRASFPALRNRYKPVTDAPYKPALGLPLAHSESIRLLPDIFHTDFMRRFLMLIESIHLPIRWNMDNFDLYLDPRSTPRDFIPWLASWFDLTFDNSWSEAKQRKLLGEINGLYRRRGTPWALQRMLEIYTDCTPVIDDSSRELAVYTFTVYIPRPEADLSRPLIERIIDAHKPAHTNYQLTFAR